MEGVAVSLAKSSGRRKLVPINSANVLTRTGQHLWWPFTVAGLELFMLYMKQGPYGLVKEDSK